MANSRLNTMLSNFQYMNIGGQSRPSATSILGSGGAMSDRKILVAVDFGTTYSAVAWLQTRTSSGQQPTTGIVDEWPGQADTEDKVPTTLQYEYKDGLPIKWGFETQDDPTEPKYQWFKLELNEKLKNAVNRRKYPKGTIQAADEEHVEQLITDYLRVLREHAQRCIKASFPGYENLFKRVPWEYIITVPAMWSEAAQAITRRCAENAGMGTATTPVHIITEPEAAGIYALEHLSHLRLSVGDTFVICDAGGGTVDLISYTVASLNPTRLEESAAGSGGLCGSTFLDRQFDKWLDETFAGYYFWDANYHADALVRWESDIKRNFNGDVNKKFFIPARGLPDDPNLAIKGGKFLLTGQQVKRLFEPVISEILALVRAQIAETRKANKVPKAVLLAGGFGMNPYLRTRIREEFGASVSVERMKDCNTAIVRGALIRGLAQGSQPMPGLPTIRVESRIARKHYGVAALEEFDQSKHDRNRPRAKGGVGGKDRVEIIQWFISKGDQVKESQPARFSYFYDESESRVRSQGGKISLLIMQLYTCTEQHAPTHPDGKFPTCASLIHGLGSLIMPEVKCKHLAKLPADFNTIPKEELRQERAPGGELWYKIPFEIEVTCRSANITFDLIQGGKKYRSINAQYD